MEYLKTWVEIFQVGIFWVGISGWEFSRGEFDGWEFSKWEFSGWEFPWYSSYSQDCRLVSLNILKVSRTFYPFPGLPWKFYTQSIPDFQPCYAHYKSLLLRISKIFDILLLVLFMYLYKCLYCCFFFRERCFVKNQ